MSVGKFLSFQEARKKKLLKRFAKEHPAEGDKDRFDDALKAMADGKKPSKAGTSNADRSGGSSGTRSRRDT